MGLFERFRSSVGNGGKVVTFEPDALRLINAGNALEAQGRIDDAMQHYLDAIRLAPNLARAHLNHGNILLTKGDLKAALHAFKTAIQHKPDYAGAYYNIGNALLGNGQIDDALASYRRALEIKPDYAEVHCALGVALKQLGQLDAAAACLRRAVDHNPDLAEAHYNLGSLLLSLGQYGSAWPEYEYRYHPEINGNFISLPEVSYPQWQGESLAGKSLLIWPEQGFGDEIQFARYIPMLRASGVTRITLVCKSPLQSLLKTLAGADAVISQAEAASLPVHDYWTFCMSLPLRFSTTLETIPAALPYLHIPTQQQDKWRNCLPSGKLKVGLVWKGSAGHQNDVNRSLSGLAALLPLWSIPGVTFISLQKGQAETQAALTPGAQPIVDMASNIEDFADTAAIVAQLDLVICVDTAIAHLAGALHTPCWVLLPATGTDWRWLRERTDTPWYPGVMRLFRQKNSGDWTATIDEVTQALLQMVERR